MLDKNIVLIGGGNMGTALLRGILAAGLTPAKKITVIDIHQGQLEELKKKYQVQIDSDPVPHVAEAGVIVLAIKPSTLPAVLGSIRDAVQPDQLLISVIAGIESTFIRDSIGKQNPVIRVMPNIAATVDAAASALAGCAPATEEHYEIAEAIFGAVGEVVRVDEHLLDAVTGLSGSGPAYIYMVIEALCDGGVKMGLPRNIAMTLATQTVAGAAKLVRETGLHPATLRDQVTTPGGTTISAIHELEERGLRAMLISAVVTATQRSKELNEAARKSNDS
jgi:pyrroline-5-carboxylate reductase